MTFAFGMPSLLAIDFVPETLLPFNSLQLKPPQESHALHGFVDDYRIDRLWNNPAKYLRFLSQFNAVVEPDFSVYANEPIAVGIWNIYRSRWLANYWSERGISVIPRACWAGEDSFPFCFEGTPQGSTIAIATMGIRDGSERLFLNGFREAIARLSPTAVLVYGGRFQRELKELFPNCFFFNHYRQQRR